MISLSAHRNLLIVLVILTFVIVVGNCLHSPGSRFSLNKAAFPDSDEGHLYSKEETREELGMELYPTGSTLPDCSHACGPCSPCKRVMVSFKCSTSESCPIVYRCMCKGKYYHVPSA